MQKSIQDTFCSGSENEGGGGGEEMEGGRWCARGGGWMGGLVMCE